MFDEVRHNNNLRVLDYIQKILTKNPYLRFTQLLCICEIDPDRDFYEEPETTLNKLIKHFPE